MTARHKNRYILKGLPLKCSGATALSLRLRLGCAWMDKAAWPREMRPLPKGCEQRRYIRQTRLKSDLSGDED
jgi:hypothetical protein